MRKSQFKRKLTISLLAIGYCLLVGSVRSDYDLSKTIDDDFDAPIVPMDEYVPSYTYSQFDQYYIPKNFRLLNCWECFQAQGKMCIERDLKFHGGIMSHTTTKSRGDAFCCKQGFDEGFCQNNKEHQWSNKESITTICSMPSYDTDSSTKYSRVLDKDRRNYQMFAFCPSIN